MSIAEKKIENEKPLWQRISGIDPARENEMTADERDAAIRKLVQDVEKRAAAEFERAESGKIPENERTVFWDPLSRVCMQLGISRTKLSSYTRELTGMRAHEVTDRILARRTLAERMMALLTGLLAPHLQQAEKHIDHRQLGSAQYHYSFAMRILRLIQMERKGLGRVRIAAELGYANPSRLARACLLAHGTSIDEMEAKMVCTLVQKFLKEQNGTTNEPPRRQERQEQQKKESVLTAEAQKIIDEAVKATVGGMTEKKYLVA